MTLTLGQSFTSLPTSPTLGEPSGLGCEGHHLDTEAGSPGQMPMMTPFSMAGGTILCGLGSSGVPDRASEEKSRFGGISHYTRKMSSSTPTNAKHVMGEMASAG